MSQLLTDFGHTRNLVANSRLQAKAQQQNALAPEQDVLIAPDQAFYRLLDAQSLLDVAVATVKARGDVQSLTQALTKSGLKSDLDLNISSADLLQAQLLRLDAENLVASARAALAELLAAPLKRNTTQSLTAALHLRRPLAIPRHSSKRLRRRGRIFRRPMSASLMIVDARLTQQNEFHPTHGTSGSTSVWSDGRRTYVLLFNGSDREMRACIAKMGIDT